MKLYKDQNKIERFLHSAVITNGKFCSCEEALEWIDARKKDVKVEIEITKLSNLGDWNFNKDSGNIKHKTGKFFSIDGIDVQIQTINGETKNWSQPIINQPEIGYLGCIVKEFNGLLYFLVQAKIEPGNENVVQISPTLQATKSNYTRAHKGNAPAFLDYFNIPGKSKILVDQLQSEQGARFLAKRNRNIIVEVDEELDLTEDFKWLTLGQIKKLCCYDNVINMDLRTVISCIPFHEANEVFLESIKNEYYLNSYNGANFLDSILSKNNNHISTDSVISWLAELKSKTDIKTKNVRLDELNNWSLTDDKLSHIDNLYFDVLWVKAQIMHREVSSWGQPILAPSNHGLIAFIVKKINGEYYFLVQAEIECGHLDIYELGPTVSCVESNHPNGSVPFLDYVSSVKNTQILYSSLQSEEGGRFYKEQNTNMIIEADSALIERIPFNYKWISYSQLLFFNKFNNFLNIGARSLLAIIRFD